MRSLLALIVILAALPVSAEDWTTSDGKTYQNVKVVRVEDDAVTILTKDGGALVPLFKLSPALQKKFSYDPAKAKIAAAARAAEDAQNAKQLQAEIDQAQKLKQQQQIQTAKQISDAKAGAAGVAPSTTP
jgi:hypothetical protein